ncbi:hypothetical protein [Streptomyces sp. SBT349]|uniref:hypothetical protein n=1 Tax=Streptomyces sp. SBT349 TaxID=1580539 RepID=UPI00066AF9B2|nr:hypothetical protein [Streptomyces sp. SBT349]
MVPPLTPVAIVDGNSGPGWTYYACRTCLIAGRLIPFALHPIGSRGTRMTYPDIVPADLVTRLAEVGDRPDLIAPVARLMDAATRTKNRAASTDELHAAHDQARTAVADLRTAARAGLPATPATKAAR